MKVLLLNIFIFFLIGNLYSQTVNDFPDLIQIFNQGKDTEIPNSLAKKYFDFIPNTDPDFDNKTLYVKEIVFKTDKFIGLSAYSDCGAGGICQNTDLIILSKNGQLIDNLVGFESDMADCSFSDQQYCSYYSDSLLIVVNQKTKGDCTEDTLFSNNVQIYYLNISKSGHINRGLKQAIDTRREHYSLSTDLLKPKDISDKSNQELAIMRNEIYAAHGYKFKTKSWFNYFSKKDWYDPYLEDVDQFLTPIEKYNLAMIVRYERK